LLELNPEGYDKLNQNFSSYCRGIFMFSQEQKALLDMLNDGLNYPEQSQSGLRQWPIKITKIPATAPFFHKAHLLLTADCVAYAYESFRNHLDGNNVLVIGCPDLEIAEITLKLTEILRQNDILSLSVMRMDTPCCKQISQAIFLAVRNCGKDIPVRLTTVFPEGELVE
jgi:hypothetical protein